MQTRKCLAPFRSNRSNWRAVLSALNVINYVMFWMLTERVMSVRQTHKLCRFFWWIVMDLNRTLGWCAGAFVNFLLLRLQSQIMLRFVGWALRRFDFSLLLVIAMHRLECGKFCRMHNEKNYGNANALVETNQFCIHFHCDQQYAKRPVRWLSPQRHHYHHRHHHPWFASYFGCIIRQNAFDPDCYFLDNNLELVLVMHWF